MSCYKTVTDNYVLPFDLYPFQQETVNELAWLSRVGLWLDMGTGKTITSIAMCLHKLAIKDVDRVVVLMPPILLTGWSKALSRIPGITHTVYRGTPTQRAKLNLDVDFVLMSYQIFKKEAYVLDDSKRYALICDESTAVKNVASQTYKAVRAFMSNPNNHLLLLSGSPLSTPHDGYSPIKLISPNIYRNLNQYEQVHVAERDFFGTVTQWRNLELLHDNLLVNSKRILKEDVLKDMPEVTYSPIYYELDSKHMKTYKTLCEQQLLKFENGEKLDATNASALFNALQQVPMNREHFTQEDGVESAGIDLVHEIMDELGDGKLVIFTNYRMTNRALVDKLAKYGVVAVFGEVSASQQQQALDRFINDPSCKVILLQLRSSAFGLDGLQAVCSDILFAEMPLVPAWFHQAVARLHRVGQTKPVTVRVAIAEKTIQERLWLLLQDKDSIVNMCVRGPLDIRDALMGVAESRTNEMEVTTA
ncbi:MAG: DEAD/DEAH box helicase [Azovibrio sp.]|uniref:DEAD/DEAH box helicase n=1 Tax=Azovibrio sp. TaxID=1872673 RepID=UPI003C7683C3